eukprot:TRINITY_DN129_c0_g3_i1.p1 TRINITY_DN129_c0_g3~~TRINITY_DN129_c0_g3_i1.p1  ORF type:complete len:271 (-),score=42.32 TRINITY_DN129_c0_g3_i1:124-936(-)
MKIGVYQGGGVTVTQNLDIIRTVLQNAPSDLDLIIFCELFLTGYCSSKDLRTFAEHADGPSFQIIAELAKKHNIGIIYGYPEKSKEKDGILYNSALFVDKNGNCIANYRKTHAWGSYEKSYFTNGDTISPIVSFEGWKIALMICYDVEFPELSRCLALNGAEILVVPTALANQFNAKVTVTSRAFENGVFLCYVNRVGTENCPDMNSDFTFCGLTTILAPNGTEIVRADSQTHGLLVGTLRRDDPVYLSAKRENPYFSDRRPELYSKITE